MTRRPQKPNFNKGDVVSHKGEQYLVTGMKHKPVIKRKKLAQTIRENLGAKIQ